jgi:hypothetical protein
MVAAVARIERVDRAACRRRVETCFSDARMADGYEGVYRGLQPDVRVLSALPVSAPTLRD